MRRRDYLVAAALAPGLARTSRLSAQTANQAKLDRIAIMSLSFDKILKMGAGAPPDPARTVDILDLPQLVADRFGVRRVELEHGHFLSTEAAYLKEFRDRVARAKSQITQINLDFQGSNVSATGFSTRAQAIDLAKQWIEHAETLGCTRVLVNPGSLAPEVRQDAIAALKIIGDYGKAHKVSVSIENRDNGMAPAAPATPAPSTPAAGGAGAAGAPGAPARGRIGGGGPPPPPATWQVVVDVIKAAGIASNPSTGNFPNDTERAAGLRALYPLSSGTSHCRDDGGKDKFAAAIKISKDVGYKGLYAIEPGTNASADPYAATKTVIDELVKDL
jgi:hypothetical protein